MSLSLTSPPFRGALPTEMTSLLQEFGGVLHECVGNIFSQTLLHTSGLSQSLSWLNDLKIIRIGGQLEWGD